MERSMIGGTWRRGAVIGAGSAYIFTRPFAKKHNLSISPVAGDGHYGVYASMTF